MKKHVATLGSLLGALAGIAGLYIASHNRPDAKPAPVDVPPVPSYTLTVHVCEGPCEQDVKIPGASVSMDAAALAIVADGAGNAAFSRVPAGSYTICARAEDYKEACAADHKVPGDGEVFLALERDIRVPSLAVAGKYITDHGEPWTEIETSEFSLYKRYLDGEDIGPILAERRDLGFNTLRVWLLNTSVIPGGLQPKDYPQFYATLPAFVDLLGSRGFVVELTAFTQTQTLMPSRTEQIAHWTRVQDAISGRRNVLLELVNEADAHDNRTDAALLSLRPVGIIASSGSNGADADPPQPVWDYVLYHSNGLSEFQRKVGHNAMEWANHYGVPAMANENTRYPDQDASETHAYDAAMGGAFLSAGSCFHAEQGKQSTLFREAVKAKDRNGNTVTLPPVDGYARAWVAGAQSVPLEFRTGAYIRRDDLNGPQVIRAYEKRLPDGRSYVIRIRP